MVGEKQSERRSIIGTSRRQFIKGSSSVALGAVGLGISSAKVSASDELLPVPSGAKVHPSRIKSHPRPEREPLGETPTSIPPHGQDHRELSKNSPKTPDHDGDRWIAHATTTAPYFNAFSYMEAEFTVPAKPDSYEGTNDPIMFYFPALQDHVPHIIQPVLQWNWYDYAADEGYPQEWAIAAWWGPDSNGEYHHGPIEKTTAGYPLRGYMTENPDYSWYIELYDVNTKFYSSIVTPDWPEYEFDYAYTTLEHGNFEYGDCNQYPGDCTFSNIGIKDADGNWYNPSWSTEVDSSVSCSGVDVIVHSDSKIEIETPN